MLKFKKIASLLILASMLVSLAACGGDAPAAETTAAPADTTEAVTTDDGLAHDDLGDIRFDGETFTMWQYTVLGGFRMEEETGDILDDAIYARNRAVEERLGVTVEYLDSGLGSSGAEQAQSAAMIEANILAGETGIHAYQHVQHSSMPTLVNNLYFVDWNTIPNVDLTKPYWCQNAISDINYGSKVFLMTGLYNYKVMADANCLIFNKRILDEANVEYPYQSVLDGTWTYDKWMKIIADTARDLNGDTVFDLANDQYGYVGSLWESPYTFFVGMGGDLLTKDKDNMPVSVIATERNVDIIDRLLTLAHSTDGSTISSKGSDMINTFSAGRAATIQCGIGYIPSSFRDMKDDFGFVPSPKFDEAQEDYNVWIANYTAMTYIPITNNELDMTGAVLEIMSMESYNRVIPAYVDKVLTVKSTRDTESEAMVPFIIERASFYDHSLNMLEIPQCVNKNFGLATYYAQKQTQVEEHIKTLAETYK